LADFPTYRSFDYHASTSYPYQYDKQIQGLGEEHLPQAKVNGYVFTIYLRTKTLVIIVK